jgi:uncharacterized repeat protein (TIGR01451 family)
MQRMLLSFCFGLVWSIQAFAQLPICPSNSTPPADLCQSACLNCGLNGTMSTSAGYTSQTPPGWCGSIENEQWLMFVPTCTSVTMIATPNNCTNGDGLQIAVYASCSGTPLGCNGGSAGAGMTPVTVTVGVTPGTPYYLCIDGWAGDQCDMTIGIIHDSCIINGTNSNGTVSTVGAQLAGPDTLCAGTSSTYTLTNVSGANFYHWEGTAGTFVNGEPIPVWLMGDSTTTWQITVPPGISEAQISVEPTNICGGSVTSNIIPKTITVLPAPVVQMPDTLFCSATLTLPWGEVIDQTGSYYGVITQTGSGSCDTVYQINATRTFGQSSAATTHAVICQGQPVVVYGQTYAAPGTYFVNLINAVGCDSIVTVRVFDAEALAEIGGGQNFPCLSPNVPLLPTFSQPPPNIDFTWTDLSGNIVEDSSIFRPDTGGTYILTLNITTPFGNCVVDDTVQVGRILRCAGVGHTTTLDCVNSTTTLHLDPTPPDPNYIVSINATQSNWSGTGLTHVIPGAGQYRITVKEPFGTDTCTQTYFITVSPGQVNALNVSGRAYLDNDNDCTLSPDDTPLSNELITFVSNTAGGFTDFEVTDQAGNFTVSLQPGSYELDMSMPYTNCPLTVSGAACEQIDSVVFLVQTVANCRLLDVFTSWLQFTRCFPDNGNVVVRNNGAITVPDVIIGIKHDALLQVTPTNFPFVTHSPDSLWVSIGDLSPGESNFINLNTLADCNAPLGTIHCIQARSHPRNQCNNWSGPRLEVTGRCDADSMRFTITNTGGDMLQPTSWYWSTYTQSSTAGSGTVQLAAGASVTYAVPGIHATFTVNQVPLYPLANQASVRIASCNATLGTTIMEYDYTGYDDTDTFCGENDGSYDPNDKQATPVGLGAENYIPLGSDLHYTVRFQNTGTAPARTVVIQDQLSNLLNWNSLRMVRASHAYTWEVSATGMLTCTFDNIQLPDSLSDPLGSQGFVSFEIAQWQANAFGAILENSADIYFDFNAPITTNLVMRTNGIPHPYTVSVPPTPQAENASVSPNPFTDRISIVLRDQNLDASNTKRVDLYDAFGKLLLTQQSSGNTLTLNQLGKLPSGMYFFKVSDTVTGRLLANGRAVKE